jgi:hypothetical protein
MANDGPDEQVDSGSDDGGDDGSESVAAQETQAEETQPVRVPVKDKPIGRRKAAANEQANIEKQLKEFQKTFSAKEQEWSSRDAQYAAEINRLRVQLEELRARGEGHAKGPSPQDLMDDANKALEAGKYSEWATKYKEAIKLEVMSSIPWNQFAQQRSSGSVDPRLQIVMNQNPQVMMHQNGFQMAVLEDQKLALLGYPDGPERWQKAFQIVGNSLGGAQQTQAQFSQRGRGALSGIPTQQQSGNGTGGMKHVELNADEEAWRKAAGMSREEYVAHILAAHPERARSD